MKISLFFCFQIGEEAITESVAIALSISDEAARASQSIDYPVSIQVSIQIPGVSAIEVEDPVSVRVAEEVLHSEAIALSASEVLQIAEPKPSAQATKVKVVHPLAPTTFQNQVEVVASTPQGRSFTHEISDAITATQEEASAISISGKPWKKSAAS